MYLPCLCHVLSFLLLKFVTPLFPTYMEVLKEEVEMAEVHPEQRWSLRGPPTTELGLSENWEAKV
jgi:hypothetical protein